jgi:hypothetical protein
MVKAVGKGEFAQKGLNMPIKMAPALNYEILTQPANHAHERL